MYKALMLVRKQIIVPSETDKRIRRLARQKGISQSALIVEAVEAIPETSTQVDQVPALAVLRWARESGIELLATGEGDHQRAAAILERYSQLRLSYVDALLLAIAERQ